MNKNFCISKVVVYLSQITTTKKTGIMTTQTISTGQSKEFMKQLMTELTIEFMRLGLSQVDSARMAKESVLENYSLFKK